jgi:hypothetical protein
LNEIDPMPSVTVSDLMHAFSRDARAHAEHRFGVALDYSERSLEQVDRALSDYKGGDLIVPDELSDEAREDLWVFCKTMGGYVGEVIIRNLGGEWVATGEGNGEFSVKLVTTGGVECFPPDAIWRMATEPYRSAVSYYRGLRTILGHGEETIENGIRHVRLPPLSDRPPDPGTDSET